MKKLLFISASLSLIIVMLAFVNYSVFSSNTAIYQNSSICSIMLTMHIFSDRLMNSIGMRLFIAGALFVSIIGALAAIMRCLSAMYTTWLERSSRETNALTADEIDAKLTLCPI